MSINSKNSLDDIVKKQFEVIGIDLISYINEPDNSKFTFTLYRRNCCLTRHGIVTIIHDLYTSEYNSTIKFRYYGEHLEFIEIEICSDLNNNYVEFLNNVASNLYKNIFGEISNIISEL